MPVVDEANVLDRLCNSIGRMAGEKKVVARLDSPCFEKVNNSVLRESEYLKRTEPHENHPGKNIMKICGNINEHIEHTNNKPGWWS